MARVIEAQVIGNVAAMGTSTPAATDMPYLTIHEVLRAGKRRAARRKDLTAAQSTWDSEGGANEEGERPGAPAASHSHVSG